MGLDVDAYTRWAKRRIYLMIYEFILEDFMPRDDCSNVHQDGNMLAGETTITHVAAQGGNAPMGEMKKLNYEQELRRGDSTLSTAIRTGETGRLDE